MEEAETQGLTKEDMDGRWGHNAEGTTIVQEKPVSLGTFAVHSAGGEGGAVCDDGVETVFLRRDAGERGTAEEITTEMECGGPLALSRDDIV